jgi:hypothetical protein
VQEELHIAARKEAGDHLKNDGQKVSLHNLHLAKLFHSTSQSFKASSSAESILKDMVRLSAHA